MAGDEEKQSRSRGKPCERRERERTRHRAEILEAAEKVLAEKGYHGASMQDIAARAEFAVGTLYKFFKAKNVLYEVLLEEKVKVIEALMKKALESETEPLARIERFIETSTEIVARYGSFFHMYMSELLGTFVVRPLVSPAMKKRHKWLEGEIARTLKEGMDKGLIRRMNPKFAAMGLIGIQRGFGAIWIAEEKGAITADQLTDMIKNMFFGGMLTEEGHRAGMTGRANTDLTTGMAARGSEQ